MDADTVRTIGKELLDPGLIDFIEDVHTADKKTLIQVSNISYSNGFSLNEQHINGDLNELRTRYANTELIGFRLPVELARKKEAAKTSYVEIFLRRAAEQQKGAAVYVRGDITVPDEAAKFSGKGTFAALLAHQETVSAFLADAENPAHTMWSGTMSRLTGNWKYPTQTLSLIRNSPAAIHRMLATGQEQEDPNALRNFFWIDDPTGVKEAGAFASKPKAKEKQTHTLVPPVIPPSKRRLVVRKMHGGFAIEAGPDFDKFNLPAFLKIEVAYDVEYGNAIKAWDPLDFDLQIDPGITIDVEGAAEEIAGNTINLEIVDPDFSVKVEGFDPHRDLVVQSNWLKGGSVDA